MKYILILSIGLLFFYTSCKKNKVDDGDNKINEDPINLPTITDIDGNIYHYITIKDKVWLRENLKVTRLNDGTPITQTTENSAWSSLTTPGYCWYENYYEYFGKPYGALYNWYAVSSCKLCPQGWHVADDDDWGTFSDYFSSEEDWYKDTSSRYWIDHSIKPTNQTQFTALPGGRRYNTGEFEKEGSYACWWSATETHPILANSWYMSLNSNFFTRIQYPKTWGFSVRCVKDAK